MPLLQPNAALHRRENVGSFAFREPERYFNPNHASDGRFSTSVSGLSVVKNLGGSTGAYLAEGANGQKYVVKHGGHAAHLREESTADRAYAAMGIPVASHQLIETPRGPVKVAKYLDGAKTIPDELRHATPEHREAVLSEFRKGFAMDALMANWDVVGLSADNVLVHHGVAHRIDNGGALRFRAQGQPKGPAFGTHVTELSTLRDWHKNPQTARAFQGLTDHEIRSQVLHLHANRSTLLKALPTELHDTINARLDDMLMQTGGMPQSHSDGTALLQRFFNPNHDSSGRFAVSSSQMSSLVGRWEGSGSGSWISMDDVRAGKAGDARTLSQGIDERAGVSTVPLHRGLSVSGTPTFAVGQTISMRHASWTADSTRAADEYGRSGELNPGKTPVVLHMSPGARVTDVSEWTSYGDEHLMTGKVRVIGVRTDQRFAWGASGRPQNQTVYHVDVEPLPESSTEVQQFFNPNHDAGGRFAPAMGSSLGSVSGSDLTSSIEGLTRDGCNSESCDGAQEASLTGGADEDTMYDAMEVGRGWAEDIATPGGAALMSVARERNGGSSSYDDSIAFHQSNTPEFEQYKTAARALLDGNREMIRDRFGSDGYVTVHRGLASRLPPGETTVHSNPLTSWSMDRHEAMEYAGPSGTVITARIPISRIAGLPEFGLGNSASSEVVVYGGDMQVMVES